MVDVRSAPRRAGRPPGSSPQEILEHARAAFLTAGFAGTTMDAVARAAAVSKASLYQSWPSKNALFRAVVTDWVDRGADAMRPHVDSLLSAPDLREALLDLVRAMQAGILSPTVLAMRSLVSSEAARHPDIAVMYADKSWGRNTALLAQALTALHDRGALAIPDPVIAAEQLTWLAVGSPLNLHELTAGESTLAGAELSRRAVAAVDTFLLSYASRSEGH